MSFSNYLYIDFSVIGVLPVSSIFRLGNQIKNTVKSDLDLGERCQTKCDADFIDCTDECNNAPYGRECLQECNRVLFSCFDGMF